MNLKQRQVDWVKRFSQYKDWESKYKFVIQKGQQHPPLSAEFKVKDNLVKGCQSQVWMVTRFEGGLIYFDVDSDALITRGLVAIFAEIYSGSSPQEILSSTEDFIRDMGLEQNLTPSRTNGVHSMLKQIKYYAIAYSQL